jgi:hypothetical protein
MRVIWNDKQKSVCVKPDDAQTPDSGKGSTGEVWNQKGRAVWKRKKAVVKLGRSEVEI